MRNSTPNFNPENLTMDEKCHYAKIVLIESELYRNINTNNNSAINTITNN